MNVYLFEIQCDNLVFIIHTSCSDQGMWLVHHTTREPSLLETLDILPPSCFVVHGCHYVVISCATGLKTCSPEKKSFPERGRSIDNIKYLIHKQRCQDLNECPKVPAFVGCVTHLTDLCKAKYKLYKTV